MTGRTHAERIIDLLGKNPGLDDDEIAQALAIEPRQTVNQICRRLVAQGKLQRERASSGKIGNRLAPRSGASAPPRAADVGRPRSARNSRSGAFPGRSLVPADLAQTLLVIPCSKAKSDQAGAGGDGSSIIGSLPEGLAQELRQARRHVSEKTAIDESTLAPAWQRYDGALYRAGREALHDLAQAGSHIVILSGGYGVVLATEPIGMYNAALKTSWWPHRILERVLIAYASRHRLSCVRSFASETSAYRTILQRVRWRDAGIDDAVLLMPQAQSGGVFKSPASLGEALAALRDRTLTAGWQSSYGLGLNVQAS